MNPPDNYLQESEYFLEVSSPPVFNVASSGLLLSSMYAMVHFFYFLFFFYLQSNLLSLSLHYILYLAFDIYST